MVVHSCTDKNSQAGTVKTQLKVNVILKRAKIKNTYYLFSTIT
jgi:hypothetical protein